MFLNDESLLIDILHCVFSILKVITAQASSMLDNSDSEGTDTKDETDDFPLNGENSARNKIKIYRTISNISNEKINVEATNLQASILKNY